MLIDLIMFVLGIFFGMFVSFIFITIELKKLNGVLYKTRLDFLTEIQKLKEDEGWKKL